MTETVKTRAGPAHGDNGRYLAKAFEKESNVAAAHEAAEPTHIKSPQYWITYTGNSNRAGELHLLAK